MTATVEHTQQATPTEMQECIDIRDIIRDTTLVHSDVILRTKYTDSYTREIAHCSDLTVDAQLTEAINQAKGIKIVSKTYKDNEEQILKILERVRLNTYFTPENEQESEVVKYEKALLLACNYTMDEAYYFAIPIPPGTTKISGLLFFFARNDKEANKIEAIMPILMANITNYLTKHQ